MKKIIAFLVLLVLVSSLAIAQGPKGVHEPGTGIESPEVMEAGQGTGQGMGQAEDAPQPALISAQEQNQGEEQQVQAQVQAQARVRAGEYTTENGKQLRIQEQSNNRIQLRSGNVAAETAMEMTQDGAKFQVKLSNGKNAEVKVMPDTASEKALERLRLRVCSEENQCQIELKEVGKGEQVRAAYEVQAQRQSKVLGLFKAQMRVQAQVDAENGEVIRTKKPWWAFMATEPEE